MLICLTLKYIGDIQAELRKSVYPCFLLGIARL